MCRKRSSAPRRAFTLIELLVVVAIIALLIAILLPGLSGAREQGKNALCLSNLHQLAVATTFYADENSGRLPYILGSPNSQGLPTIAPFYQYHQIFNFWPYIKDMKIYLCPSAKDDTSVKSYDPNSTNHSYYTVLRSDDRYLRAYHDQWWPLINPASFPTEEITPLYTEYWFNDWSYSASQAGRPIPQISGGLIGKIPLPAYAVVMSDAVWEHPKGRHRGGNDLAFLDAHVGRFPRQKYLDSRGTAGGNIPVDYDAFGNRPFYAWGLTREGFNALP